MVDSRCRQIFSIDPRALEQPDVVLKNTCQLVGEPYGRFALRAWTSLLLIQGLVLAVGYGVQRFLMTAPWLIRASAVSLIGLAAAAFCGWFFWLNVEERIRLKQVLDRIYRRLAPAQPVST